MKKFSVHNMTFKKQGYIALLLILIPPLHSRTDIRECEVCTQDVTTAALQKKQASDIFTIFSVKDLSLDSLIPQGKNVLVIFDIDNTLITSTDIAARSDYTYHTLHTLEQKNIIKAPKDAPYYNSIIWRDEGKMVIEPAMKDLFDALSQTKRALVEVIAMTDISGGKYGTFKDMLNWRYHNLKDMGFTFSTHFTDTVFTNLQKNVAIHPRLYRGIVASNSTPKGTVLTEFLRIFNYKPDLIIFFDDTFKNIASVQQACHQLHIPFKGFYYLKKLTFPEKLNKARADQHIRYLLKNDIWLSAKPHTSSLSNNQIPKECS